MRNDDGTIPAAWLARSAVVVYALRPDDRRCDFVTPNVEALTGSSVGEAMAPGWWRDRLHPDDRDRLLPRQAEPGDGAILSDDYRFRHRDGHDLWLRDQRRLVREPDGSARVVGTWTEISELVAAREALAATARRYRRLFDSNPVPTWVYDVATLRFLFVNDAAVRRYGYSSEEFLALTIRDIRPDEDRQRLDAFLAVPREALLHAGEWRHLCRDGTVLDVEISSHDIVFGQRPARMVVAHDVTGRKRAERALRDSESELRRAQQIANLGRWSWHIPSHRVEWSEQMYQIFGLDAETFTGDLQTIVESAIHPDDRAVVERVNREVATTGRATPLQYRVVRPDGSVRTVWGEAAELERDADGRPLRLTGIVQDITDRVQSDVERARLVAAIEQAGEAIVITDRAGAIQYVNPAFEQVTGYGRAEVLGRNPRLLQSGRQSAAFYREMWETIASGATWRGRLVNRRKDGALFTEDAVVSPVLDDGGEIASYVAVKRDVSAELALETQLRQAQKLEAIGSLAGGIAHDFNNMLGVILGNAELVMTDETLPEPARERIVEIVRAGERSAQLTRQLLGFARKQSVTPRALDLNETVEGLLKMLRRLIGENVELDWRPASSLWVAWMDPSQVDQILTNLCVNARDAIAGAGRIAISTGNRSVAADDPEAPGALSPGDYVWLAVRDSGCGMDADVLAHIFEPFYTTKETGQGTGLGLATVYGIVQQNRGQITVDSRPGGGAIFTVMLPRHHGAPVADEPAAARATPRGHGECVLVVEDDPALLRVLVQTLTRHGYEALAADGPAAALAVAAAHPRPIHLLLSDVVMPGMTGYQLAEQFAALRPAARRLFMSGYASGTQLPAALAASHLEFIQKPFAASDLAARLRELLAAE